MPPEKTLDMLNNEAGAVKNVWDSFSVGKMLFPLMEQLPDSPQKFQFALGLPATPAKRDQGAWASAAPQDLQGHGMRKTMERNDAGKVVMRGDAAAQEAAQALHPATQPGKVNPGEYAAMTSYVDFMQKLTHPDPTQRLSPSDALKHPFMTQALVDETKLDKIFSAAPKAPSAPNAPKTPKTRARPQRVTPMPTIEEEDEGNEEESPPVQPQAAAQAQTAAPAETAQATAAQPSPAPQPSAPQPSASPAAAQQPQAEELRGSDSSSDSSSAYTPFRDVDLDAVAQRDDAQDEDESDFQADNDSDQSDDEQDDLEDDSAAEADSELEDEDDDDLEEDSELEDAAEYDSAEEDSDVEDDEDDEDDDAPEEDSELEDEKEFR